MNIEHERLVYCLEAGFPHEIITALLRLADQEISPEEAWYEWSNNNARVHVEFEEAVEEVTGGSVQCCYSCNDWQWYDDTTGVASDDRVCQDCLDAHYTRCYECSDWIETDDARWVEDSGEYFCDYCCNRYCEWCESCEEYTRHGHEHEEEGCECDAPIMQFRFPANGKGEIGNDERLEVTLPAGTIDDVGLQLIRHLLADVIEDPMRWTTIDTVMEAVGTTWHGKKGNFTRRLSRELYNARKMKVPDGVLSQIGNLAREHSSTTDSWSVEFTRDLNLPADAFAHADSCWWQSYFAGRCALKNWGGLAIRSFGERGWCDGRAWVQPLNEDLEPTHDAMNAHAYVVYNCYGKLDQAKAARIIAHLTSNTYRRVTLFTDVDSFYINSDMGWFVGPEATTSQHTEIRLGDDEHHKYDASALIVKKKEMAA